MKERRRDDERGGRFGRAREEACSQAPIKEKVRGWEVKVISITFLDLDVESTRKERCCWPVTTERKGQPIDWDQDERGRNESLAILRNETLGYFGSESGRIQRSSAFDRAKEISRMEMLSVEREPKEGTTRNRRARGTKS